MEFQNYWCERPKKKRRIEFSKNDISFSTLPCVLLQQILSFCDQRVRFCVMPLLNKPIYEALKDPSSWPEDLEIKDEIPNTPNINFNFLKWSSPQYPLFSITAKDMDVSNLKDAAPILKRVKGLESLNIYNCGFRDKVLTNALKLNLSGCYGDMNIVCSPSLRSVALIDPPRDLLFKKFPLKHFQTRDFRNGDFKQLCKFDLESLYIQKSNSPIGFVDCSFWNLRSLKITCEMRNEQMEFLASMRHLNELTLVDQKPENVFPFIKHLPLTHLDIQLPLLENNHLVLLSKLPLKYLRIADCNITDQGLKQLTQCTQLHSLILEELPLVTDSGLKVFVNIPIQRLKLSLCKKISGVGLQYFTKLKKLCISLMFQIYLTNLRSSGLKTLKLSNCSLRMNQLTNLLSIETLFLENILNLTNTDLLNLKGQRITHLVISGNVTINDQGLYNLQYLPIEQLTLRNLKSITEEGLRNLTNLPLERLSIIKCHQLTSRLKCIFSHVPVIKLCN